FCDAGTLIRRTKYRMSGVVVMIGYILLIPSLLGVAVSILLFFGSTSATKTTVENIRAGARSNLRGAVVPETVVEKVVQAQQISEQELLALTEFQRETVRQEQARMTGGTIGAGIGGAMGGGISLCSGISCFVGGLLGWLLVMKKKVL